MSRPKLATTHTYSPPPLSHRFTRPPLSSSAAFLVRSLPRLAASFARRLPSSAAFASSRSASVSFPTPRSLEHPMAARPPPGSPVHRLPPPILPTDDTSCNSGVTRHAVSGDSTSRSLMLFSTNLCRPRRWPMSSSMMAHVVFDDGTCRPRRWGMSPSMVEDVGGRRMPTLHDARRYAGRAVSAMEDNARWTSGLRRLSYRAPFSIVQKSSSSDADLTSSHADLTSSDADPTSSHARSSMSLANVI